VTTDSSTRKLCNLTRPTTYTTADGVKVKEGEKVWWWSGDRMQFQTASNEYSKYCYSSPEALLMSLSHEQLLDWSKKQLK